MTATASSGPVNARDAGAAAGLRADVLYRSDAPLPGDAPPDLPVWPPGSVLDLRGAREQGTGPHPLAGPATRVVHLPLNDALAPDAAQRVHDLSITLPGLYLDLLAAAPRWLPALVDLAANGPGPLLVHCAAGKDRTGITVAVLLAVAGASREAIMADYARTNEIVPRLVARLRDEHPHHPDVPADLAGAPAEALAGALDRIGPDVAAWCREQGASPTDIDRWCARAVPAA